MASVNKAILVGNLGQDPEVRSTGQGTKVVTLSVATSESWKDRNSGERKERTEWHRVVIFGAGDNDGLAGVAEKYLKKGSKVYVSGQIKTRKWQDQAGADKYSTEIVLQGFGAELVLLDGKGEGGGNRPPPAGGPEDYGRQSGRPQANRGQDDYRGNAPGGGGGFGMDDDIPFAPEWR